MSRLRLHNAGHALVTTTIRLAAAGALAAGVAAVIAPSLASAAASPATRAPSPHATLRTPAAPRLAQGASSHVGAEHGAIVRPRSMPHAGVTAKTFVVNVLADSPLATPTSKVCVDAANGKCSLRAAVQAANNLAEPVVIKLTAHTYKLTDSTDKALTVTNDGGTTFLGVSEGTTRIQVPAAAPYQAVYVSENAKDEGGTAFLSNLTVEGGTGEYGGGLEVIDYASSLVLDHVSVTGNTATYGGGVACYYASLWATDSSISSNSAGYQGGGLYSYWGSTYLSHTSVDHNSVTTYSSTMYGGGIYDYYGSIRLLNSSASYNAVGSATEPGYGGGIYDYYAGDTLVNSKVDHNTANDSGSGAGAYLEWSTVSATGTSYSYDHAKGTGAEGGGIAAPSGGDYLQLHHVVISNDTTGSTASSEGGGGIFMYSDATPNQLEIDGGSQISNDTTGGVVLVSEYGGVRADISDTQFKGDSSALVGAGALLSLASEYSGNHVSLTDDQFLANHDSADASAGAILADVGSYGSQTLTMSGCLVQGNSASGAGSGGGVVAYQGVYSQTSVDVSGSKVLGNRAPNAGLGGGISAFQALGDGNVSLQLSHDTINGNVAGSPSASKAGRGGGVYVDYYVGLTVTDSTIDNNVAEGTNATSGAGGGIYDLTYTGAFITGSTIDGNRAVGSLAAGGGLYTYPEYGSTDVVNSTIDQNSANVGGGIYIYYYQMVIDESTVAGNVAGNASAGGAGGGLYDYASDTTISNSTFTANRAMSGGGTPGEGGALFDDDAPMSLYFATVTLNDAAQGGAVYVASGGGGSIRDSILASNHTAPNAAESECHAAVPSGVFGSVGDNVLSRANCVAKLLVGDVVTLKPMLGALAGNGGPTKTMALLPKSPAMNAVHGDCLPTDQRGAARPTNGVCDAGAYQHAKPKPRR